MQNGINTLSKLSPNDFQAYGFKHASQFEYRIELAKRIASTFNVEHLIVFDDVVLTVSKSQRISNFSAVQGCDRSLLPALWLAAGFKQGATIIAYSLPNSIELRQYLDVKQRFEKRLHRSISIRIIYQGLDVLSVYENSLDEYNRLSKQYQTSLLPFSDDFFIYELKRHFDLITYNGIRSLVFPFVTMELHRDELANYENIVLPDLPTTDKAEHNFLLRQHGFTELPHLLMIFIDGSVIDNYDAYEKAMKNLSSNDTLNTPENVARFSKGIVSAIDRLHYEYQHEKAFLKLDAVGAGGWSCVSPCENPFLYDWNQTFEDRVKYLIDCIEKNLLDDHLPSHAVVEEFVDAQIRPGGIEADYTVCGFVLDSIFYPTSMNLCGTDARGQYIEQWTASEADQIDDNSDQWQHMFEIYARMVAIEAKPFGYRNGIYAGDVFLTKDNQYKQRDWNIRRGGRSTPEALTMLGEPNYEVKINVTIEQDFNSEELLDLYTKVCDRLTRTPYYMYPFSTGYCHFCKSADSNLLRFDILVNPQRLLDTHGKKLDKSQHRQKLQEIVQQVVDEELENMRS